MMTSQISDTLQPNPPALMPDPPFPLWNLRYWNIAVRTVHLAAMGILLGGHFFEVSKEDLLGALYVCVASGVALLAVEAGPRLIWFHQGRGLLTMAKLVLILLVPWFWSYRLPILLLVLALGSIGSHAPARLRYYSFLTGEIVRCGNGPGERRLD